MIGVVYMDKIKKGYVCIKHKTLKGSMAEIICRIIDPQKPYPECIKEKIEGAWGLKE